MKWLKRGFWLAAWGVWLWLGFGLHRELPRKLGPAKCNLLIGKEDTALGFMGQTNSFAVIRAMGTAHARISVFDASDGNLVRETPCHAATSPAWFPRNTDDPMFVFVNEAPSGDGKTSVPGLSVFDLDAYTWRRLSESPYRLMPIAVDGASKTGVCLDHGTSPHRLIFFDLAGGKELTAQDVPKGRSFNGGAFVDPSNALVAISTSKSELGGKDEAGQVGGQELLVWRLGRPPTIAATFPISSHDVAMSASRNGRIAFTSIGSLASFQVFDLAQQKWIFARLATNEPPYDPKERGVANEPLISPSGRAVLDGTWSLLWDIESAKLLWSRRDHEAVLAKRGDSVFLVREEWSKFFRRWSPSLRLETWALRDLDTGTLIVRTAAKDFSVPFKLNGARTLAALNDGTVHSLSLTVNYPLLALCQTILALPLILLWAILRWRRNRRLRLAGVQS